ncbi:hypothetical protein GCM10027033_09670 [Leucobacter ruminantium]
MVAVVMREHEQCDALHAEALEAGGQLLGIVARVDEHRLARPLAVSQQQRVALADIACDDAPVARDAGGRDQRDDRHRPEEDAERAAHERRRDDPRGRREGPRSVPRCPGRRAIPGGERDPSRDEQPGAEHCELHRCEQQRASPAARPRPPRGRELRHDLRRCGDPAGRQAREHHADLAERRCDGQEQQRDQAEARAERRRRRGERVGEHARCGDARLQQEQERPAGDLRGKSDGDRQHQPARHGESPEHRLFEQRGEEENACGRRDGERESGLERLPGIGEQQYDHRGAERGERERPLASEARDEHHDRHDRRALHARVGADDDHEPSERRRTERHAQAPTEAQRRGGPYDRADQNPAVRPSYNYYQR